MPMHHWDENTVRFMLDAVNHSTYFQKLAQSIAPFCSPSMKICDAGCGLGHLSFELAKSVRHIDAVDKAPQVIALLKSELEARGLANVSPLLKKLATTDVSTRYDLMVFCLSEPLDRAVRIAQAHHARTVIVINKLKHLEERDNLTQCPTNLFSDAPDPVLVNVVTAARHEYSGKVLELELGQPLCSRDAAQLFFETYKDDINAGSSDYSGLYARLEHRADAHWPYYLPKRRKLCLFAIELDPAPAREASAGWEERRRFAHSVKQT